MKSKVVFSLVVILSASTIFSQETETNVSGDTQKIKIRAKREIYDPLNTSIATTIITSDELKAKGAKNLSDALQDSVGLQVQNQGKSSILTVRGSRTEQVVILINGQKLNSPQGLGVDLNAYSVDNVERIEVIRGSATTRYGANATGGVINIITKDRVDNLSGVDSRISYGSYNNFGVSTLVSKSFGKDNRGSIFVSGVLNSSKNNFPYSYVSNKNTGTESKGKMPNNDLLNASGRVGLSYKFNSKDVLNFDMSALHEDKGLAGSYGSFGFSGDRQEVQNYAANLSYENNSFDALNFGIKAGMLKRVKTYAGAYNFDKYNNTTTEVSAYLDRVDRFGGDVFTFKNSFLVEYKNDYFHTDNPRNGLLKGNTREVYRNTVSLAYLPELGFLNFDGTSVSRLTLSPGIRFDAIICSGAVENKSYYEPSYSLGAMYTIDKERRYNIKANFNTGYRIPGFDDLYSPDTGFSIGNPNLKKENSVGGDLGFIITPHDIIRLEALYYISEHKNLITWLINDTGGSYPFNIGEVLLQGIEANMLLSVPIKPILSKIELNLNYLYQFGKIVEGSYVRYNPNFTSDIIEVKNNKLARTPNNSFNAMLSYVFDGNDTIAGRLNFYTHYIGKRYNAIDNIAEIPETLTFDLTASLTLIDTITIEGGVKNIADVKYENVIGYLQPGREWYTAISAKF